MKQKRAPRRKDRVLINIKVTPGERALIRDAAAESGVSMTEFLRRLLMAETTRILRKHIDGKPTN